MEGMVLVYVRFVYKNNDGTFVYEMFFSNTPDFVWGVFWDVDNPAINGDVTPDPTTYQVVKTVTTTLPLKTAEETTCMSMEYVTYRILALAWIDIENLEEYPEKGRMVLHFGDPYEFVVEKLGEYEWNLVDKK